MNQCKLWSSVVNFEFPRQPFNLFITGRCIIFCEYHIRWQFGLIKNCTFLNCGSIQVFCKNRSSISIMPLVGKIHYKSCICSLIYLLSTRVDLSFTVHKLAKFSANPGKVHFEGFVHLLRYIRDNKTLGLKYYAYMNAAPVSNLLR